MKLDGRLGGCDAGGFGAGLGDGHCNRHQERRATATACATTATASTACGTDQRGLMMSPRDCSDADRDAGRGGQMQTATAGSEVAQPKTSAVGSSLFTIDSILAAPSRPSDATAAVSVVGGRNPVTAATAGFFKQPISFGHLAAAAAASGYTHSTAANFLGKLLITIVLYIYYLIYFYIFIKVN